jgi:uncharacterized CHY-type Zn-finger protein
VQVALIERFFFNSYIQMTSLLVELQSYFRYEIDINPHLDKIEDIIITDEFEKEFYTLLHKVKTFNVHISEYRLMILFDILLLIYSNLGIIIPSTYLSCTIECISILLEQKPLTYVLNRYTQFYLIYLGKIDIEDLRNLIDNSYYGYNFDHEVMKYIILSGHLKFVKLLTINYYLMETCLEYTVKCNHDEILNYLLLYYKSSDNIQRGGGATFRRKNMLSLIDFVIDIALKYNTNFKCFDLLFSHRLKPYNLNDIVQKLIDNNNFECLNGFSNHYLTWYTPYRLKFIYHCSISEKIKDDRNKVLNIVSNFFPIEIVHNILSYLIIQE